MKGSLTNSLCNSFSSHFEGKTTQVHVSFLGRASSCNINFLVVHHHCTVFKRTSLTEVVKLIWLAPNKSCELDHIPTFLLKPCLHTLIVPITKIINLSLCSGVFPSHFKHACINILKKPSLPINDQNSYRSISNLSFISNILENCNNLSNVFQSAHKQFISLYRNCSTESSQWHILLDRLFDWYDISGTTLTWICSFLTNRSQSIKNSSHVLRHSARLCS